MIDRSKKMFLSSCDSHFPIASSSLKQKDLHLLRYEPYFLILLEGLLLL